MGGIDFVLFGSDNTFKTLVKWDVDEIFTSDFVTFSINGQYAYIKDSSRTLTGSLVRLALEDNHSEVLYNDPQNDIELVVVNPQNGEVDADIALLNKQNLVDMRICSRDRLDTLWIVRYEKATSGISYYLFNRNNNELNLLFYEKSSLLNYSLAQMEPIEFLSRDGLKLRGYITLPKERTTKPPYW